MFDKPFPTRFINRQTNSASGFNTIWNNYCFKGKNNKRYIVIAEQFDFMVFVVKYYLAEHKSCEQKFNKLSGQHECSRVIATVGRIMVDIYNDNPFASFAFIGSPLNGEGEKNTKRFRVYSKFIENVISPTAFEHKTSRTHSAYLLLNRNNQETDLLPKIENMFRPIFEHMA